MKATISLLLVLTISTIVSAQPRTQFRPNFDTDDLDLKGSSELSASYGLLSTMEIPNRIGNTGEGLLVTSSTGNYFGTYRYYLGDRVALGATFGTQQFSTQIKDDGDLHATNKANYTYTTAAIELLFIYASKGIVHAYTYAGAGCWFSKNEQYAYNYQTANWSTPTETSTTRATLQYVPIGFSVGGAFSGFIELGIGYKGLLNGGLSFRF